MSTLVDYDDLELDEDGQPVIKAFNARRNFKKSVESLLGICRGLIADGQLNELEILFLDTWLKQNRNLTDDWPANMIANQVQTILADGVITAEESDILLLTLEAMLGGSLQKTGMPDGLATRLPIDHADTINFNGRSFCMTGKFIYGPRDKCEQAVIERGGLTQSGVNKHLNYLVIGTLASRDWVHTSHGRKIEAAVANKERGYPVMIIAEETWVKHLV